MSRVYIFGWRNEAWLASESAPLLRRTQGSLDYPSFLPKGWASKQKGRSEQASRQGIPNREWLLFASEHQLHAAGKRDKVFPIGNGSFRVVQIYDVTFRLDTERKSYTSTCLLSPKQWICMSSQWQMHVSRQAYSDAVV